MKLYQLKNKARNFLHVVLRDPDRKSLPHLLFEFIRYSFTDRKIANQYFHKNFHKKGAKPEIYQNYVLTDKLTRRCWDLNNPDYINILNDKYLFENFFSEHRLPVVKSMAYNYNSLFYYKGESRQINSAEEFMLFLQMLMVENPLVGSLIIKKMKNSSGGIFIYKVNRDDLTSDRAKLSDLYRRMLSSEFLIQEFVQQHNSISAINPYCLNTIRIDTFTNKQNMSRIFSMLLRVGMNQSYVDNVNSGGVYVGIDLDKGSLRPLGYTDITHGGAKTFTGNMVTGVKFEGYPVPFFMETKELVLKASRLVPQIKLIGWDVAILPKGPVLLEGNDHPGIPHSELSQGGFAKSEIFNELLSEVNENAVRKGKTADIKL